MGRPRKHQHDTAEALVAAAERIVESDGLDALTVRRVAESVGTTTRAVYTVYGSKDALLVALGRRAFDLLRTAIEAQPTTTDPAADLVEAGVEVFRRFAVEHPALFRIGVQRAFPEPSLAAEFRQPAREALAGLSARVQRIEDAGLLGGYTVREAVLAFHALCEGLAAMELRALFPAGDEPRLWREALHALVRGFAARRGAPESIRASLSQ
jgi:AcrR family transcriptional regulator